MKKKCVIIVSGGIDSGVLMSWLYHKGYNIYALTFNYGQSHSVELKYSRMLCKIYAKKHIIMNISNIKPLLQSDLTKKGGKKPKGKYNKENIKNLVVPNRNGIMLNIAVGWAESIGAKEVYYSPHANDTITYPDCRPEYVRAIDKAVYLATDKKVRIKAPFMYKDKSYIVKLGSKLYFPFKKSYSCYCGGNIHCGSCPTCIDRKIAFEKVKVNDPTEYEE